MLPESAGVLVEFGGGDVCPENAEMKLTSEIEFRCHLADMDHDRPNHRSDEVEKPIFVSVDRAGCQPHCQLSSQTRCPTLCDSTLPTMQALWLSPVWEQLLG